MIQYGKRFGKTLEQIEEVDGHLATAPVGTGIVLNLPAGITTVSKGLRGLEVTYYNGSWRFYKESVPSLITFFEWAAKLEDATEILARRGRVYDTKRGLYVHAWEKDRLALEGVKEVFGGGVYPHPSGWLWRASKRGDLIEIGRVMSLAVDKENPLTQLEERLKGNGSSE